MKDKDSYSSFEFRYFRKSVEVALEKLIEDRSADNPDVRSEESSYVGGYRDSRHRP